MSMDAAVASLEARLAAGNGSPDDWELLAKSYEFLNRPADAARARTHRLPAAAAPDPAAAGAAVSGQVSLAPALRDKAPGGAILFIIAKAVDQPGAPVAVLRSTVHDWPVRFRLDDSHSMLPGHTLSSAGKVTIEARISQSGQPLAGAGDLQGVMGPVDPASNPVLSIVIDKVLR
jgi:cytochrome c-type biogenesis protein CcmH